MRDKTIADLIDSILSESGMGFDNFKDIIVEHNGLSVEATVFLDYDLTEYKQVLITWETLQRYAQNGLHDNVVVL